MLISVEGVDRVGKTTFAKHLAKVTNSFLITFPNRTNLTGNIINNYLRRNIEINNKYFLNNLFSLNRWEEIDNMQKILTCGQNIIVDRYIYSGIAYSMVNGLSMKEAYAPDIGLPLPAITYYLYSTQSLTTRDKYGEERYEYPEFQLKVSEKYNEIMRDTYFKSKTEFISIKRNL